MQCSTPLSLVCTILLCLPLAVIITTTPPRQNLEEPKIKKPTAVSTTNPPPSLPQPIVVEDEADRSLLKHASRVDPVPNLPKKLAFMFLTTTKLPLAPLWELFFARAATNLYNIYVHAYPGVNHTAAFHGVFAHRAIPSKPTSRHTSDLISAARRLLARALLHDKSNSMFALLSPSCIPLHSFNYTYTTLIESSRSFIEMLDNEPDAYERWSGRGVDAMLPEVEFQDFRIGSQFWVVNREHSRIIVRDRRLWSKFKLPCLKNDTCYPEEHYFPTLLSMVDPLGCIPCTLTHVDWNVIQEEGGHPACMRLPKCAQN